MIEIELPDYVKFDSNDIIDIMLTDTFVSGQDDTLINEYTISYKDGPYGTDSVRIEVPIAKIIFNREEEKK